MGENLVVGDGPWTVTVKENWLEADIRFDGVSTYVVVEEDDGTMKIGSHAWTGTAGPNE